MVDEGRRHEKQAEGAPPEHDRFERVFEVSIKGLVPAALLANLGDVEVASQEMRTVLTGQFRDQAEVYGFLERLRAYALEVVEVRRIEREPPDESAKGVP
jgi:hypothetical protein